jgi:hypothetical protein
MEIVFFTAHEDHIKKVLPEDRARTVSGRLDSFGGRLQMAHPDYIVAYEKAKPFPRSAGLCTTEALPAHARPRRRARSSSLPSFPSGRTRPIALGTAGRIYERLARSSYAAVGRRTGSHIFGTDAARL